MCPVHTYLSSLPVSLEGGDVLTVFGVEQAEESAVAQPLLRRGCGSSKGSNDGCRDVVTITIAARVGELDHVRHREARHVRLGGDVGPHQVGGGQVVRWVRVGASSVAGQQLHVEK